MPKDCSTDCKNLRTFFQFPSQRSRRSLLESGGREVNTGWAPQRVNATNSTMVRNFWGSISWLPRNIRHEVSKQARSTALNRPEQRISMIRWRGSSSSEKHLKFRSAVIILRPWNPTPNCALCLDQNKGRWSHQIVVWSPNSGASPNRRPQEAQSKGRERRRAQGIRILSWKSRDDTTTRGITVIRRCRTEEACEKRRKMIGISRGESEIARAEEGLEASERMRCRGEEQAQECRGRREQRGGKLIQLDRSKHGDEWGRWAFCYGNSLRMGKYITNHGIHVKSDDENAATIPKNSKDGKDIERGLQKARTHWRTDGGGRRGILARIGRSRGGIKREGDREANKRNKKLPGGAHDHRDEEGSSEGKQTLRLFRRKRSTPKKQWVRERERDLTRTHWLQASMTAALLHPGGEERRDGEGADRNDE